MELGASVVTLMKSFLYRTEAEEGILINNWQILKNGSPILA